MGHEDPKSIIALAAGGFKDMSRIAKSSPRMWGDIFKQNRKNLLDSIDLFEEHLQNARKMVEENYEVLEDWMKKPTHYMRYYNFSIFLIYIDCFKTFIA